MGMICCNDAHELFLELEECKTIEDIQKVMRQKAKEIPFEIKEIEEYLKDSSKVPQIINVNSIAKDSLEKRIPYITEIQKCFEDCADLLLMKNYLNLIAIKEYMKEMIDLYTYTNDDSQKYISCMLRFKEYVNEEDKYHNKLLNEEKGRNNVNDSYKSNISSPEKPSTPINKPYIPPEGLFKIKECNVKVNSSISDKEIEAKS